MYSFLHHLGLHTSQEPSCPGQLPYYQYDIRIVLTQQNLGAQRSSHLVIHIQYQCLTHFNLDTSWVGSLLPRIKL